MDSRNYVYENILESFERVDSRILTKCRFQNVLEKRFQSRFQNLKMMKIS